MSDIYHPQAKFQVDFQYTRMRHFSFVDQSVLQLLYEECSLNDIPSLLGLPKRMVVESAFDMLKEGMLNMNLTSLELSSLGEDYVDRLTEYPISQIYRGSADIICYWNTGHTKTTLKLESDIQRFSEASESGDSNEFYNLEELDDDCGAVVCFENRDYTPEEWRIKSKALECTFGDIKKNIEVQVRSSLRNHLNGRGFLLYSMESLEKRFRCYRYGYKTVRNMIVSADSVHSRTPEVQFEDENWLTTPEDHCVWFQKALADCRSHLLVFSAHEHPATLERIKDDFHETIDDSFLILGYTEDAEKVKLKKSGLKRIADPNSNSDMKIVIYDDQDGNVHMALGSFNWLKDYKSPKSLSKERNIPGYEISLVLHSSENGSTIFEVLEALQAQIREFTDNADKNKLLRALGNLKQLVPESVLPDEQQVGDTIEVKDSMFVSGQTIATESGLAMRNASNQCLVLSHTISERIKPFRRLQNRDKAFGAYGIVAFSDMYPEHVFSEQNEKASSEVIAGYLKDERKKMREELLKNTHLLHLPNMHSRIIVNDDTITVTSLNSLSALGAIRRSFGLKFKDPRSAEFLMQLFEEHMPDIEDGDDSVVQKTDKDMKIMVENLGPEEQEKLLKLLQQKI